MKGIYPFIGKNFNRVKFKHTLRVKTIIIFGIQDVIGKILLILYYES